METLNFQSDNKSHIIVWKIQEEQEYFLDRLQMSEYDNQQLHTYQTIPKRVQWLASRYVIRRLVDTPEFIDLQKDKFGKPILKNQEGHVSLTHTNAMVAGIINKNCHVGIDLELIRENIDRVAHKFVNDTEWTGVPEQEKRIEYLITIWSAKEAMYKLYGSKMLDFRENMIIDPFTIADEGVMKARLHKDKFDKNLEVKFRFIEDHVMTWVEDPSQN